MSIMEESDNGVKIVEYKDEIVVEDGGWKVRTFDGKDPDTVGRAHDWADGFSEAKKQYE